MRKKLGILFALVLGLPLAFLALTPFYAGRVEQQASDTWRQAGLPFEDFPARYPRAEENSSARRLRELAVPLGITFPTPNVKAASSALAVQEELQAHVKGRLDGKQEPVPAALQSFRERHAAELEALLQHLAGAEAPRWEQDTSRGFAAPFPSLQPLRQISQVLLLEALERPAEGERGLTALWNLSASLRERPELISVLIGLALDSQMLALARRLESVPPALATKLGTLEYRSTLPRIWQNEAWMLWYYSDRDGTLSALSGDDPQRGIAGRLTAPLERRYLRLCAADDSRVLAALAVETRALEPCSPPDDAGVLGRLARWNVVGRIALPSLTKVWQSLLGAQLDVELTRKVLALRAQRGPDGAWPESWSDTRSEVCSTGSWSYTRNADDGISLAWSGPQPQGEGAAQLKFTAAAR